MAAKLLCIVGPTASGKTSVGIAVARRLGGEIVSADSVQVYRGMDIGSAKPTADEQIAIKHHMIDCVAIDDAGFSCAAYAEMASAAIHRIEAEGRQPVLVGGSGLYIDSLVKPLSFAVPRRDSLRKELEDAYDSDPDAFYEELREIDPLSASRIHRNDRKRAVRAVEVFRITGKTIGENNLQTATPARFDSIRFGLLWDRETLYGRINDRVDRMMNDGFPEEASRILSAGYDLSLPAMQSIGYRQLFSFLLGRCSLEEAVESIKQETRRYAKRQMTWFRADPGIRWIDMSSIRDTEDAGEEICSQWRRTNES